MADDINTLQENIVPQEVLDSQEAVQNLPPSTEQNQLETDAAQIEQEKNKKQFKEISSVNTSDIRLITE